jgi:hypothetical protein
MRESWRGRRSSFVGRRKKKKHSPPRRQDTKGIITGRTGREGRKDFTAEAQRRKGHKGEKMQGISAEVTEKRGLWLVDYPSLI